MEGSQGRYSNKARTWKRADAETAVEHCLQASFLWLAQLFLPLLPRDVMAQSRLGPPASICNGEHAPQTCSQAILMETILQWQLTVSVVRLYILLFQLYDIWDTRRLWRQ